MVPICLGQTVEINKLINLRTGWKLPPSAVTWVTSTVCNY